MASRSQSSFRRMKSCRCAGAEGTEVDPAPEALPGRLSVNAEWEPMWAGSVVALEMPAAAGLLLNIPG